jgi:diaminopimelate epimerase
MGTMEIEFLKLQCCGGDYLVVDALKNAGLSAIRHDDLAVQITSRRFGVGAAGLVLILPGRRLKLRLACFDPAGQETATDPLAVRCAARYAFDAGLLGEEVSRVEARDEAVPVEVLDSHNITVPSGPPSYWGSSVVLRERPGETFTRTLRLAEREFNYTPVRIRGEQAVFFPASSPLELDRFGPEVEADGQFAADTQLVFARVISGEELAVRAWKVGHGELLASEEAACAAAVAAVLSGFGERQMQVHLEGGNLFVDWAEEDDLVYASGSADYVFLGTYYYDEGEADEK